MGEGEEKEEKMVGLCVKCALREPVGEHGWCQECLDIKDLLQEPSEASLKRVLHERVKAIGRGITYSSLRLDSAKSFTEKEDEAVNKSSRVNEPTVTEISDPARHIVMKRTGVIEHEIVAIIPDRGEAINHAIAEARRTGDEYFIAAILVCINDEPWDERNENSAI